MILVLVVFLGKIQKTLDERVNKIFDRANSACRNYVLPFLFIFTISNAEVIVNEIDNVLDDIVEEVVKSKTLPDPLLNVAKKYQIQDRLDLDGSLDNPYEKELGVDILGEPTVKDLEKLVKFRKKHLKGTFADLGIEEIIIFPTKYNSLADYGAKYRGDTCVLNNQMWFFSGEIAERYFVHEVAHCKHHKKKKEKTLFLWELKWKLLAGPYNKVIRIQQKGLMGVEKYLDGTIYGPKYGYVDKYGGKNLEEDIATYVEEVVINPFEFRKVQTDFEIYHGKLELLLEADFITKPEYKRAVKFLEKAEKAKITF